MIYHSDQKSLIIQISSRACLRLQEALQKTSLKRKQGSIEVWLEFGSARMKEANEKCLRNSFELKPLIEIRKRCSSSKLIEKSRFLRFNQPVND